jgi:hypothetical protein
MSIVPENVIERARNGMTSYSVAEIVANRAAEWALEPMYAELYEATKGTQGYEVVLTYSSTEAATKALDAIRAMISQRGRLREVRAMEVQG